MGHDLESVSPGFSDVQLGTKTAKEYKCPPGFAIQFPKGFGPSNSTGFLVRIHPLRRKRAIQILRGQRRRLGKHERQRVSS